jgi:hypothetical protein
MRDVLAALLRSRGWEHDDTTDPADLFWSHPKAGVRPMMVALCEERNESYGTDANGYYTTEIRVQQFYPARELASV